MNTDKKEIRTMCKKAKSYQAWRNPTHVWFVTLFDEKNESFFEIQYSDVVLSRRERLWIEKLLCSIKEKQNNE